MSLKEKQDEISSLVRNIESAQHEKDNLTTQVEILEQAVQTMRYMIKDILQRINEQDDAEQQTNTPTSSSTTAPHVAAGGSASSATPADADALPPAKPTHARRSSTGMLPPVGGALSSSTVQRGGGGGGVTASGAPSTGSAATATSTGHADSRSLGSEGGPVAAVSPPARPMIACRGIGKDVPRFLAYSGWVSKYDLGKRHTELIIKEIWSLKSIADENRRKSGLPRTTLPDFFAMYLRSRFPLAQTDERALHAQMEFVYNFVRSCSLWRSDHDMDLFHQILFGHTSEERYHDQMTMMAHLKKGLAQMDVVDGVRDGFIHKAVFFAGLRQFFPIKSEADMRALIDIVLREMQTECKVGTTGTVVPSSSSVAVGSGGGGDDADGGIKAGGGASSPDAGAVVVSSSGGVAPRSELAVDISKLMAETSDGDESSFINALRKQYEEELNSFPVLIADTLTKASKALFRAAGGAGPLVHVVGGGHGRSHSLSTGLGGRSVSPGPGSLIASSSSDGHGGGGVGVATGLHPALSSSSSGGWLPAGQIAAILQELDPNKSSAEIDAYMRRGLGLDGYFLQHALQGGAQRHEQVLREHGKSDVQGSPTLASMQGISSSPSAVAIGGGHGRHMSVSSSRATTPNHQQQHLRNASRDVLGGSMVTSPEGTVRKGSFNIASISTAAAAQGVRRDSLNNSGSAPSTPLLTSASQGQLVPPSTTRAHSRMSVGAGLTNLAVSPSAGSINAAAGPSPSSPLSQVPMSPTAAAGGASGGGGAALPSASGTSSGRNSRESSRRSSASKNVVMGHMSVGADGRIHANYTHVRSGSRSRSRGHSRSTSMMGSIAGFAQQGVVGTLGTGATGGIGGTGIPGAAGATSYDPSMFVELSLFLSRLNTLFLHRTGHYNADLDLAGLRKLIKDELERAADDERKARELAAAKKGLGTGLQVNALALPSWAALFPTWKRVANDPHIRAEVFNALAHKYSKNPPPQQQTSANDEMDQRPSSGASQASRSSSHRSGARTPATTLSTEPVTPADALAALALPSTPESRFAVNESFNQIVTYYRGDSTKLQVDAIVNAANPALVAGGGICAAIFAAAGHAQLSKACAKLGGASYGSTKVTPGFKLPSRFVLHTVSPVNPSDSAVLESCYNSILDACLARGLRSVAMCCLATGITGFRHVDAAEIALRTTRTWLENHQDPVSKALPLDRIVFTVFTEEDLHIYNALLTIFFPCAEHGSTHPTPGVGASGSQWPLNAKAGEGAEEDNRRRSLGSSLDSARAWAAEKAAEALSTAPLARAAAATASTATTTHRKGRHGRTGSIGLGLGGPLDLSLAQAPLEAAAAASLTAAEQSLASLNSLKLKRQQQQQQAGSGAGGRSLAAYRYELPPSLVHKPAPPPKTAAEVFHSGTVAHFVPPPVKPKQPEAGQQSSSAVPMKEYHAQRSGTGVTSAPHSAQMMASVSSGASSSSRGKHPKTSAPKSGLAKLMSRSSAAHDDGEDDDD
jgi:O-acetyl-ADP-ribose deacetylase (regulator of RNase III)